MSTVKYDTQELRTFNMFESITGVEAIDAILNDDTAYFIVPEGKAGMAIGKGGKVVQKVQNQLDKDVKIYEYSDNIGKFLNNVVPADIRAIDINEEEDEKTVEISVSEDNKGKVVGRNGKKIEAIRQIMARTHSVDDVKVS